MKRAATITRPTTELTRKSVADTYAAGIRSNTNRMSQCYMPPKNAEFNRQARRLETALSSTKQTPATQFNRQLSGTRQNASLRAISSHSPLTTSHCLFRQEARITASSAASEFPRLTVLLPRPSKLWSLVTQHSSLLPSRRTCRSAKKQQIRWSLHVSLGLYFLASYAHFPIGTQRALVHNGGTEVTAGYNDKKIHAAVVGMEPSRERQSIIR
jgi:hypothetical protein